MSETTQDPAATPPAAGSGLRPELPFLVVLFLALAAIYIAFAVNTYAGAEGLHDALGVVIGRDFSVFWTASVLALQGDIAAIFDLGRFSAWQESLIGPVVLDSTALGGAAQDSAGDKHLYPWLYPPHALFAILPLGLLPYLWAYALWCLGTLGLYLAAVLGRSWADPRAWALALAPATLVCLFMGQNGLLTAALLVGGLRLVDRRPLLAGVLLGLLCFKPQLGLLVPVALAAAALWRPFLGASVTVIAVLALSLVVFGADSWIAYWETTTGYQAGLANESGGLFLNIAATPYIAARILGLGAPWLLPVHALFALPAVAGVALAFRRPAERRLQIAVLLAAVLLVSPYGYHYDLPLVSVAVLWGFLEAARTGFLPGERILLALVWVLPLLIVFLNPLGLPLAPPVLAAFFALLLARVRGWLPGISKLVAQPAN